MNSVSRAFFFGLWIAFGQSAAFAQPPKPPVEDGPVGIFATRQEYNEFMRTLKFSVQTPEEKAMIPLINDIVLNRPIGWTGEKYGGVSSSLGLLSDAKVREGLEMVEYQYEELRELNTQIQQRMAKQLRNINLTTTNVDDLRTKLRDMQMEANQELEALLLPHQIERLRQLFLQNQLRRRSLVDLLINDPLRSTLEITEAQTEELREAEVEIEAELQREIAILRAKAHDKLISKLVPAQQKKLRTLIGDQFDFAQASKEHSLGRGKKTGKPIPANKAP